MTALTSQTTSAATSPLLVQAVEDLLAGAAMTAPLVGSFVPEREIGARLHDVSATCALGAVQVGYALRLGLPRRDVEAPDLQREERALRDAYRLRYRSSLIKDNDRWGRDAVTARCKELVNTLPPADLEA